MQFGHELYTLCKSERTERPKKGASHRNSIIILRWV